MSLLQKSSIATATKSAYNTLAKDLDKTDIEDAGAYMLGLKEFEKGMLESVIWQFGGNKSRMAAYLRLNRSTLHGKIKRAGLTKIVAKAKAAA